MSARGPHRPDWGYYLAEPLLLITLFMGIPFTIAALIVYAATGHWIWSTP